MDANVKHFFILPSKRIFTSLFLPVGTGQSISDGRIPRHFSLVNALFVGGKDDSWEDQDNLHMAIVDSQDVYQRTDC